MGAVAATTVTAKIGSLAADPAFAGVTLAVMDFEAFTFGLTVNSSLPVTDGTLSVSSLTDTVIDSYSGQYNTTGQSLSTAGGAVVRLDFAVPTRLVGFRFGATNSPNAPVQAYNAANQLLGSSTMPLNDNSGAGNDGAYMMVVSDAADISYVIIDTAVTSDDVLLDDITYPAAAPVAVPTLGQWAMVMLALLTAGAAGWGTRRNRV